MDAFPLGARDGAKARNAFGQRWSELARNALLTGGSGLGYALAAWGGLTFLTGPSGVAIFWPASGLSAGLALALGRTAYGPIALGVVLATIAINLYFGRGFWLSTGFSALNACETLLFAFLLELHPKEPHGGRRLSGVIAFFAAAILGTVVAGFGASLLIQASGMIGTASLLDVWRTWSLADLVGITIITPLVVAIHELISAPELRKSLDWKADAAILFPFFAVAYHTLGLRLDDGTWISITPGAALLPLLLWLSARSQPIVPALAMVVLAVILAWFAAAGAGRYGDARLPAQERILAAQLALVTATVVAQVVLALYSDRRLAVGRLKASEMRLAAIVDTAPGVIFSAATHPDGSITFPFVSSASAEMLGVAADDLVAAPSGLLNRLAPGDARALSEALRNVERLDAPLSLEFPLVGEQGREIWIEIKARAVQDGDQAVVWHGFIQDVTMRRRLVEEMGHRTRNLLSVTQAIAEHTARHTKPSELADVLTERLASLAASHQLLAAHDWECADAELLAESQLSHLSDLLGHRIRISGPRISLQPTSVRVIGMALHELATNACKYGALANGTGTIALSWDLGRRHGEDVFSMRWDEQGGSALPEAAQQGFGSKITIDMPAYELKAKVSLEPRADGLRWSLTAPAANVVRQLPRPRDADPRARRT